MNSVVNLYDIDWDFNNNKTHTIHNLHPYPAKFIPEIPKQLIKLFYPNDNSIIFDPFCGSGTTLVEAIDIGVNAVGVDLNPIACLISKVKTTPIRNDLNPICDKIINNCKQKYYNNIVEIPEIPNLDHWFKKDIQKILSILISEINSMNNEDLIDCMKLAVSNILIKSSNQESDTRYAAIEKNNNYELVLKEFKYSVNNINYNLHSFFNNTNRYDTKMGNCTVIQKNILEVKQSDLPDNIGLVITSPPYPNAYEYWLYHKYRMYWLNMDPIWVRTYEIGARPHYQKKNNPQNEEDFKSQMNIVFKLLSDVMNPNSIACFVIGDSIIKSRLIDNASILNEVASNNNFAEIYKIKRNLPKNKRSFNPILSQRKDEYIVIYELRK